jgi:hypothetical protein
MKSAEILGLTPYSTDPLIVGDIRIYQAKGSNLEIDYEARGCLGCAEVG